METSIPKPQVARSNRVGNANGKPRAPMTLGYFHLMAILQNPQITAISNEKGGVGKTVTTANIGAGLQRQGKKVLLVDFDPQSNLSISFGIDPDELHTTLDAGQHLHQN